MPLLCVKVPDGEKFPDTVVVLLEAVKLVTERAPPTVTAPLPAVTVPRPERAPETVSAFEAVCSTDPLPTLSEAPI